MLFNQAPLAERMRPAKLSDYIGQEHLLHKGAPISEMIKRGNPPSIIFWGPPGVGKTTLANLIAQESQLSFHSLSAIQAGVKEVRQVLEQARRTGKTLLFIDEIHRFNKAQQDALLGAVEKGIITLIGATTENPSFEVIGALLSRCQVYVLKEHSPEQLKEIALHAIEQDSILKEKQIQIKEWDALLRFSGGDARKLLNQIELLCSTNDEVIISNARVEDILQRRAAMYDKNGEQHYDIISAFIKSMRGSDPNAAVYWLARMLDGGEDPKFIARRMLILASEDVGNANPNAMILANSCFQAINVIGMPEARIILSQTAIYLACSPKSNAAYKAIGEAMARCKEYPDLSVPLHLRNAPTRLMKDLGYAAGYKYSHEGQGNFIGQEYLPKELEGNKFFEPGQNQREEAMRQFLKERWKGKYNY